MKEILNNIKNIFKIKELKIRIKNTIICIIIFRIGSYIILPGIDISKLSKKTEGIFNLLDTFLGGAFSNLSIFGLGIMPYISASIIIQFLTIMIPYFQKIQKDGESGKNTIDNITKFLTIFIAIIQSFGYLSSFISDKIIIINKLLFIISSIIILISGTMFCVWMGNRITEKGIGNGISILITTAIISSLPKAIISESILLGIKGLIIILIEIIILFLIIMLVIIFTQAIRKIPIQYAKQILENKIYNKTKQYIPIKVNSTGVIPIIFSQTLMFLPPLIMNIWNNNEKILKIKKILSDFTSWQYNLLFATLIILFTCFYTKIIINPNNISNDIKKNKGFIPGVKPGNFTTKFIENILNKIILPSSIFLACIAILPAIVNLIGIGKSLSKFYGGTSLIIIVTVIIETIQQIKSYLLINYYKNIIKSNNKNYY